MRGNTLYLDLNVWNRESKRECLKIKDIFAIYLVENYINIKLIDLSLSDIFSKLKFIAIITRTKIQVHFKVIFNQ